MAFYIFFKCLYNFFFVKMEIELFTSGRVEQSTVKQVERKNPQFIMLDIYMNLY